MDQWSGKVALVTGAGGGIGIALVGKLIHSGMKVVGCDYNLDSLKILTEKYIGEKGELHTIQCNLRKEDEILSMFDEIKQKYGGVDVCVNSAGVLHNTSNISGETETWREHLEVNVLALSICTREAIKSMKERKVAGHIVHMCSVAGHYIYPYVNLCMYNASKHAVKSLTESLRVELRQEKSDIRISSISPGMVQTPMSLTVMGKEKFHEAEQIENYFLLPEDVVSAIMYMLSCPPRVQVHDIIIRAVNEELS